MGRHRATKLPSPAPSTTYQNPRFVSPNPRATLKAQYPPPSKETKKMSISEAQLRANRENAKKSTGPTSIAGRKAVRLNSLKHGFSGHTVVIADHEIEAFAKHLENFRAEYKPV